MKLTTELAMVRFSSTNENAQAYTTVDDVAKLAERTHKIAIANFKRHYSSIKKLGVCHQIVAKPTGKNGGRPRYNYTLNRAQAVYFANSFNNDKLKMDLAQLVSNLFDRAEQIQDSRILQHEINKPSTNALKDAVHNNVNMLNAYDYSNVFYLVYGVATGLKKPQLKALKDAGGGSITANLSAEQNARVRIVQITALGYLAANYTYKQLKTALQLMDLSNLKMNGRLA